MISGHPPLLQQAFRPINHTHSTCISCSEHAEDPGSRGTRLELPAIPSKLNWSTRSRQPRCRQMGHATMNRRYVLHAFNAMQCYYASSIPISGGAREGPFYVAYIGLCASLACDVAPVTNGMSLRGATSHGHPGLIVVPDQLDTADVSLLPIFTMSSQGKLAM